MITSMPASLFVLSLAPAERDSVLPGNLERQEKERHGKESRAHHWKGVQATTVSLRGFCVATYTSLFLPTSGAHPFQCCAAACPSPSAVPRCFSGGGSRSCRCVRVRVFHSAHTLAFSYWSSYRYRMKSTAQAESSCTPSTISYCHTPLHCSSSLRLGGNRMHLTRSQTHALCAGADVRADFSPFCASDMRKSSTS